MGNGTAIYVFESIEYARKACDKLNNFVLDKNHTFKAYTMSEYESIIETNDNFIPPRSLPKQVLI